MTFPLPNTRFFRNPESGIGVAYRYGFNGKDREIEFSSGAYDFGARIHDARLGRWMSVDPMVIKYPSLSPFVSIGNLPIKFIDSDGAVLRDENGNIIFYWNGTGGNLTINGENLEVYNGYVVANNGDWVEVQYVVRVNKDKTIEANSKFSYNCHGYSLLDGQFVVDSSKDESNDLIQGEALLDTRIELKDQASYDLTKMKKGDVICLFDKDGVVIHSYIYEGLSAEGVQKASSKNGTEGNLDKDTTVDAVFNLYKKHGAVSIGYVTPKADTEKNAADAANERDSGLSKIEPGVVIVVPPAE